MKTDKWYSVDRLEAMYDEVDTHPSYKRYIGEFQRAMKFYRGDGWWEMDEDYDDVLIDDRIPVYKENEINRAVNDANSILLKNKPIVHTHPMLSADSDLSNDMDQILYASWKTSNTQHTARTMLKMSQIGGLAIGKTYWNKSETAKHPDGEVGLVYIAPTMIRVDPVAPNDKRGRGARYIIHSTMRTPEEIAVRYGTEGLAAMGIRNIRGRSTTHLMDYYDELKQLEYQNKKDEDAEVDKRIEVREYWLFPTTDDTFYLVTGIDPTIGKYKYGAVVTLIKNAVVRIDPNPFNTRRTMKGEGFDKPKSEEAGHKMHPFVFWYWKRDANEDGDNGIYECEGMVKQMESTQVAADALGRNIHQNASSTANAGLDIIEDALVTPLNEIFMLPGEILRFNAAYGGNLDNVRKWRAGNPLPAFVMDLWREKKRNIPLLGGVQPGMTGLSPEGTSHLPTGAVAALQEASFTPMWSPTDELEAAIEDIAIRYLGMIQQYYKPDRYVDISDVGEARYLQIQGKHITSRFNLFVVAGTTTPLYDIERDTRLSAIQERVDNSIAASLAMGSSVPMQSCLIYLRNLRYPYAYDWIQLLRQQIDILESRMQDQMLQEQEVAQMQEQQPQEEIDYSALEELAGEGQTPDDILAALES